ncbi:unnamed protein product [Pocillopora meandrina]|uniref:G-protein coupled receptors family 1 profile domain-containing protein n=1 Tax=Pocillopora meandrina TaxID=46732 RepID=A0AAU9WVC2_9CNID|nr:unnamed protein product [Pocillopora meandrina]
MLANMTSKLNGTRPMSSCFNPSEVRIRKTIIYCLICAVSLVGNSFIGIVVLKMKALKRPISVFIVNMAMSDLSFTIFLIPKQLVTGTWLISGPLGKVLCKLYFFSVEVSNVVSIQTLFLIAADRFGAVFFHLRYPVISSKQCRFFILATWIIAMAFNCPNLISFKLVRNPKGLACKPKWSDAFGGSFSYESYASARFTVFWHVPLVLISVLYVAIAFKVKSQKTPGEESINSREQRLRREKNVLRMSVAIVMTFAVCWLPISISQLLRYHSSSSTMISSCAFQYIMIIAVFLASSNCAINPFICFLFSENYNVMRKLV